jgi:diaminopimelate epimerase
VAEAVHLGLDHQEVLNNVRLYERDAGSGQSSSSGALATETADAKLRKLQLGELKLAVQGHKYWTETRLLDHRVSVL